MNPKFEFNALIILSCLITCASAMQCLKAVAVTQKQNT